MTRAQLRCTLNYNNRRKFARAGCETIDEAEVRRGANFGISDLVLNILAPQAVISAALNKTCARPGKSKLAALAPHAVCICNSLGACVGGKRGRARATYLIGKLRHRLEFEPRRRVLRLFNYVMPSRKLDGIPYGALLLLPRLYIADFRECSVL